MRSPTYKSKVSLTYASRKVFDVYLSMYVVLPLESISAVEMKESIRGQVVIAGTASSCHDD